MFRRFCLTEKKLDRGNHHLDPLLIDLFKLCGIRIPRIRTRYRTGFVQYRISLIDLLGKLIDVAGSADRLGMYDQPMLIIHHALHVVAGMTPLNAVH